MNISFSEFRQNSFYYTLLFTAGGFVWGNFLITLCSFLLFFAFILDSHYKHFWQNLKKSKLAWCFLSVGLLFSIRAFIPYSSENSMHDFIELLPFFVSSVVFIGRKQLSPKQFNTILLIFTISVFFNTLLNFAYYYINYEQGASVRQMSLFMSYIRLAMYTILATVSVLYVLIYSNVSLSRLHKIALIGIAVWLMMFILLLSSFTGYIGLVIVFIIVGYHFIKQVTNPWLRYFPFVIILIIGVSLTLITIEESELFKYSNTKQEYTQTSLGNPYKEYAQEGMLENGRLVDQYVSSIEIKKYWNHFFSKPIDHIDLKEHSIYSTALRYMTSKGITKDFAGLRKLTEKDISCIESGISNHRFTSRFSVRYRIYQTLWEIHIAKIKKSPAGNSITQRAVFLNVAYKVWKKFMWFGTGPIEFQDQMNVEYAKLPFTFPNKFWLKTHNQYMFILLQYGIIGMLIFLTCFIGILIYIIRHKQVLSLLWLVIIFISFFNEDTLDTLYGIMFFAFWGNLFLNLQPKTINVESLSIRKYLLSR